MSITSDIRTYADTAVSQGRQGLATAQTQLNSVLADAEKAVNLDAVKSAVDPYVAQVKDYAGAVSDKAEGLFAGVVGDPRVGKLVNTATALSGVVVETVNQRVVKPVQALTGLGGKPAAPTTTTSSSSASDAGSSDVTPKATAARTTAAKASTPKPTPAKSTPAKSTPAKAATSTGTASAARKAPAKKSTDSHTG